MNTFNIRILILICFCQFSFASPNCDELLSRKTIIKSEIAKLLLEKEMLVGNSDHALKVLIQSNVARLVQEYQELYGTLNRKEISSLLADERSAKSVAYRAKTEQIAIQKKVESEASQILQTVFSTNIGEFYALDDHYLLNEGFGSGIMWTKDEKFVLLRPKDESKSLILNTETKKRLRISATAGILSNSGSYFAGTDAYDNTKIYDLENGKKFGPFNGFYAGRLSDEHPRSLFNEQYICLFTDEGLKLVNYQNGNTIHLGEDPNRFVFSDDLSRVALIRKRGKIEVIESSTGKILKTFKGNPGDRAFLESLPGFFKLKQGNQKYLVRFSDFKKFEAKSGRSEFVAASADRSILISSFGYYKYLIHGFGKKPVLFDYFDEVELDPHSNYALFTNRDDQISKLFDFKTYKTIDLPNYYSAFSADGNWLLDQYKSASAYHIPSGQIYEFADSKRLALVPNSEFVLIYEYDGQTRLSTLQGQLDGAPGVDLTENVNHSPQGNFLIIQDADESIRIERIIK